MQNHSPVVSLFTFKKNVVFFFFSTSFAQRVSMETKSATVTHNFAVENWIPGNCMTSAAAARATTPFPPSRQW